MKMRLKPVFQYHFKDYGLGSLVFLGVMAVLVVIFVFGVRLFGNGEQGSMTGMGIMTAFCFFVFGVAVLRQGLRLCLQLGVSRRTAFCGNFLAAGAVAALVNAALEVLTGVCQLLLRGGSGVVMDMYQMAYRDGLDWVGPTQVLDLAGHGLSWLLNLSIAAFAFALGAFLTLGFWRLHNTFQIVLAALAIPALLNGVPWLVYALDIDLMPLMRFVGASALHLALLCWAGAALLTALGWLLMRRVSIRAPGAR